MTWDKVQIVRLTWKRLVSALRELAGSDQGPKAVAFGVTLVVLMLGINGLNVLNSFVGRHFISAIENHQMDEFERQALYYVVVLLGSTVVAVFYRFTEERLGILWREELTRRLTDAYLRDRTYFRLEAPGGVANPDQRIADDVRAFTTTTLSFVLLIVNGTITAVSFSGVLWSISPLLFGVAVGYAMVGSALTIYLGKPLIRLNYNQLDMEANFRADLIHVRENSESIALAHREGRFRVRLNKRLRALATNFRRLIRVNRNLGFFTNGYNYFIQLIPAFIIAPMFIGGELKQFGVITQSTMAFATLLGAFSIIVTQFQSISAFSAVVARLHTLSDAIERAQEIKPCAMSVEGPAATVVYSGVTLHSANRSRVLVERLDWEVVRGSRWLVTGKEDAPKVALFRATAGLWECGAGEIIRPSFEEILFLPERPYLPPGTLREVLLRTGMETLTPDEVIMEVLGRLGVDAVVTRANGLDADHNWDDILSIGEQHLLSMARILLARPAFVYLDRPGSALTTREVAVALEMFSAEGIGVVVLAKNGESQLRFDAVLEIHSDGTWSVKRDSAADHSSELADVSC